MPPIPKTWVKMLPWSQEAEDLAKWYDPEFETTFDGLAITEPRPLTEFTLFNQFPPELQLVVWGFIMPEARIIEILWDEERGYYTDCPNMLPIILHVCRFSRYFALEKLMAVEIENFFKIDPDFGPDDEMGTYRQEPTLGFYINPAIDILYMSMGRFHQRTELVDPIVWLLRNLENKVAEALQHIATDIYLVHRILNNAIDENGLGRALITRFPQLKSLGMIISDVCMARSYSLEGFLSPAPRREPLAMRDHDRNVIMSTFWNPIIERPETRQAPAQFQDGKMEHRRYLLRKGTIEMGVDEKFVEELQWPLLGIVRGDVCWDGLEVRKWKAKNAKYDDLIVGC